MGIIKEKVLMVATVSSMIGQFNMNNIQLLKQLGYEVHVACNFNDESVWTKERTESFIKELESKHIKWFQINFSRSAFDLFQHLKSLKEVNRLIKKFQYKFIHCHTPIAGAIVRLAAKKENIKVIYTAHGFHFYKGAPLKNWILYYPIEKILSQYTEILITINKEDYILSKKKLLPKHSVYVPGVGIDTDKFIKDETIRKRVRNRLGIRDNEIVLFSVGELSKRKNHKIIIEALNELDSTYKYYICGQGNQLSNLKAMVKKYTLEDRVKFLGYSTNVLEYYNMADIFVFPSLQEGLPVALMEAMACGLPIICSDIRGNSELVDINRGGFPVEINNNIKYKKYIRTLAHSNKLRLAMGRYNQKKIKQFTKSKINMNMTATYKKLS